MFWWDTLSHTEFSSVGFSQCLGHPVHFVVSARALNVVGFLNLIPSRKSSRCCLAIWFTKVEARDRFLKTSLQKLQINSSAKYSSSSFSGEGGGNSTLKSLTSS